MKKPIAGCKLGLLYNFETLLQTILDKRMPSTFQHITSLKDVKELKVEMRKNQDGEDIITCPLTMLEYSGYNT